MPVPIAAGEIGSGAGYTECAGPSSSTTVAFTIVGQRLGAAVAVGYVC